MMRRIFEKSLACFLFCGLFGMRLGNFNGVEIVVIEPSRLGILAEPGVPTPLDSVVFTGSGYADVVAQDPFVFVAAGATMKWAHYDGESFDNSGSYDPPTGGNAKDIFIAGNTIYMSDRDLGILKYTYSPSGSVPGLSFVGAYDGFVAFKPKGIFVHEDRIFVACDDSSKLCVVDTAFTSHNCVDLPNRGQAVFVKDTLAYVVYGTSGTNGGIVAFTISDLTMLDTTRVTDAGPTNLWVEGSTAYVTINSAARFLKVFDVSNPTDIRYVGRTDVNVGGGGRDVEVISNADTLWGYVACGDGGLAVVNLSVSSPFPVRSNIVFTGAVGLGIEQGARRVFVISEDTLRMFHDSLSLSVNEESKLVAQGFDLILYPNPFNVSSRVSFELPFATKVDLSIFDILGRKIKTFASGILPRGSYSFTLAANELSSGIYFMRLQTEIGSISKRVLLMK